jgi:hypothetical protein
MWPDQSEMKHFASLLDLEGRKYKRLKTTHWTTRSLESAQGGSSSGGRILMCDPLMSLISLICTPDLHNASKQNPCHIRPAALLAACLHTTAVLQEGFAGLA